MAVEVEMQTAQALRLAATVRRHTKGASVIHLHAARSRTRLGAVSQKGRSKRRGWLKPLLMALLVAGEWLLIAADVFSRFYFAC
jgi:hypothetical protein